MILLFFHSFWGFFTYLLFSWADFVISQNAFFIFSFIWFLKAEFNAFALSIKFISWRYFAFFIALCFLFLQDSICSWISEPESVVNNWRGWRKNIVCPPGSRRGKQKRSIRQLIRQLIKNVHCNLKTTELQIY